MQSGFGGLILCEKMVTEISDWKRIFFLLHLLAMRLPGGVIGNTSDSGSEDSRFDSWPGSRTIVDFKLSIDNLLGPIV